MIMIMIAIIIIIRQYAVILLTVLDSSRRDSKLTWVLTTCEGR